MANTDTWNSAFEASPADIDDISEGAERIRDLKTAVRERMSKDHYMEIAGTDADHGEHSKVTLRKQSAKPTAEADKGYVYTKIVGDHVELFFENEDGTEIQLTVLGALPTAFPAGLTTDSKKVLYEDGTAYQDIGMNSDASAQEWYSGLRALLTAAGSIITSSAANTPEELVIGAAGNALRSNSDGTALEFGAGVAIEAFTKDSSISSTETYTGAGFKASTIILILGGTLNSGYTGMSIGATNGTTNYYVAYRQYYRTIETGTDAIGLIKISSMYQTVTLSEITTLGCKLTWTETGNCTGTITGCIIYLR